jgi:hypothetical protein
MLVKKNRYSMPGTVYEYPCVIVSIFTISKKKGMINPLYLITLNTFVQ